MNKIHNVASFRILSKFFLLKLEPNIFSNVMIIYLIRNSSEKKTIKLMSFSDSQVLLKAFKFSVYQTF